MNAGESGVRRRKPLAAGVFQPEISSFRLALAAKARPPRRCGTTPRRFSGSPLRT